MRRFKTYGNQQRPRRAHAGFRGTLRYVSLRVHAREEPGPADDLVSLFYSMIELIRGSVPWRSLHHNNDVWLVKEKIVGSFRPEFRRPNWRIRYILFARNIEYTINTSKHCA